MRTALCQQICIETHTNTHTQAHISMHEHTRAHTPIEHTATCICPTHTRVTRSHSCSHMQPCMRAHLVHTHPQLCDACPTHIGTRSAHPRMPRNICTRSAHPRTPRNACTSMDTTQHLHIQTQAHTHACLKHIHTHVDTLHLEVPILPERSITHSPHGPLVCNSDKAVFCVLEKTFFEKR